MHVYASGQPPTLKIAAISRAHYSIQSRAAVQGTTSTFQHCLQKKQRSNLNATKKCCPVKFFESPMMGRKANKYSSWDS